MKNLTYLTLALIISVLIPSKSKAQNSYCDDASSSLFCTVQPEQVDSALVTYAVSQNSIDEFNDPLFQENLALWVFYPHLPTSVKRPLILLIHGGGFIGGSKNDFYQQAKSLAELGFVCATIDYRLCKRTDCLQFTAIANTIPELAITQICNVSFPNSLIPSGYVAVIDAFNALRYLKENASLYHIDTENIIVGGTSAGGWTALNMAFLDQDEAALINSNLQSTWGAINPTSGIKGVIAMGGAIYDTNFIDSDEKTPVFILHGTCDPVIYYQHAQPYMCQDYQKVYGGGSVALRLQENGNPFYLYTVENGGHQIFGDNWKIEMLHYIKSTMLCGAQQSKHVIETINQNNENCLIIAANSLSFAPVAIPTSSPWADACSPEIVSNIDIAEQATFEVFPTLTDDMIQLHFQENGLPYEAKLIISDVMGNIHQTDNLPKGTIQKEINVANLPAGIYVIAFNDAKNQTHFKKIVKY
ncbi:MAG: alpha/beta hydrolase fold domain-containing protein [Saprospiraceae bacterium]|nr:alpha/beta hydrolase fold domain-containing protein [Saprospiraceae bacterium]